MILLYRKICNAYISRCYAYDDKGKLRTLLMGRQSKEVLTVRLKNIPLWLCLLLIIGCATTGPLGSKGLLDFLENGRTTKEDILLKLGQPSGTYEDETVLTYRIGGDEKRGFYVVESNAQGWHDVNFSLVLIFKKNAILKRHSLVPVR